jgi:high affinity sulfate transporter 1
MNGRVLARLARIVPGIVAFVHYRREDLRHDVVAGVCVASVALPVGVAYAELAGFNPAIGLYSCMWPLVAYALFGTSRQLIVGPDAATCALIAASIAPLAAVGSPEYTSMSITVAFLAGVFCIAASFVGLGACADFLSRPILTGFMNGIAISIALGQAGKLLGFKIESMGVIGPLIEIAAKIGQAHLPTLIVGLFAFALLLLMPKFAPRVPAALATLAAAACVTALLSLDTHGVRTIGAVPAGLPSFVVPRFSFDTLDTLAVDAAGIALISFCSATLTARSFAAKNGYDIEDDRELSAIGAANIASALSHGFAISGADSRTAMNDMAGGRTQLASIVAAAAIAFVLIFLTGPLRFVPTAALGAVLVMAAISLVDITTVKALWSEARGEFAICIVATVGVVALGSLKGIMLAVALALVGLVWLLVRRFYHGRLRRAIPWACGHPFVNARMQDTAEGFGQPIREIFAPLFRIERQLPSPFDARPVYRVAVTDRAWALIYQPIERIVTRIASVAGLLQTGRIAVYLMYSFLVLIVLLILVRR